MPTKPEPKPAKMPALQAALDQESYEWLATNSPDILTALETEIHKGKSPNAIYLYVVGEYGREELARRLQQAARQMQRGG